MDTVHECEEPEAEEPVKATTTRVVPTGMWCSYAALGELCAYHCVT